MKISIITATFNSQDFILSNINSIKNQTYKNFEHLIIDNKSSDKTLELLKNQNYNIKVYSSKDAGIYDAFNKGIKKASGEIISIINSDDLYADKKILDKVVEIFKKKNVGIIYGNLKYVKRNNIKNIVRFWKSNKYKVNSFKMGWSPPHPTVFVKKEYYKKFGTFKKKHGTCADLELLYRFIERKKIKSYHLDKTLVLMRLGGVSNNNLFTILKQNLQILKILKINNNLLSILKFLVYKIHNRIKQFTF